MVNERIRKLRRLLDLTQQEFADRIGMKRNTVANYETNRNEPSASVITLICREFQVNEEWLRTGGGEIFAPKATNALDALAKERNLTHGVYLFIEKLLNLKPEYQQVFVDLSVEVAAALADDKGVPADSHEYPTNEEIMVTLKKAAEGKSLKKVSEIPDDGDEEDYANLAREQRLLEKEAASQASSAKDSDVG